MQSTNKRIYKPKKHKKVLPWQPLLAKSVNTTPARTIYIYETSQVTNGFLYGVCVSSLYGPQPFFANSFLIGPIWFIHMGQNFPYVGPLL